MIYPAPSYRLHRLIAITKNLSENLNKLKFSLLTNQLLEIKTKPQSALRVGVFLPNG